MQEITFPFNPDDGPKIPKEHISRPIKRERKQHQKFIVHLSNTFLKFKDFVGVEDKEVLSKELDRLDKLWKSFVTNWNSNKKHHELLQYNTFIEFLNKQIIQIQKKEGKKNDTKNTKEIS